MSDTPRCDAHSLDMETEDFDVELAKTYELAWQLERELNAAKAENAAMREAIKEAHSSISMCVHFMLQLPSYDHLVGVECEAFDLSQKALSKLQPYLK